MTTPSFNPQPCCGGAASVQDVNVTNEPLDVNVTNTVAVAEPLDVNVTNTVAVAEPLDVNVLGTVPVSGSVGITGQPISTNATIVGQPVAVTLSGQPVTATIGGSTVASTTLTAASAVGNGTTVDFANAKKNVTLFALVNGTVTSGVVDMQASHDGTNWVRLASTGNLATGANQYLTLDGGAFRYYRGTVSEALVGGGTVTATLMYA